MEENKSKSKQKKLAKKMNRKKGKSVKLLRKQGSIKIAMFPTKNLLVANGGLGNTVSREEIVNLFRPFGLLESVTMEEQMPHCFVTFSDVEFATNAVKALNGHLLSTGSTAYQNVTLYVSYVDKVPDVKPKPSQCPEGLFLISNFIDEELERELLGLVKWESSGNQGSLKHRKVKHFGYDFNYDTNNVDINRPLEEPMPTLLTDVIDRIMQTSHVTHRLDQVTVNQYLPGQGIPPHVDTHSAFEDSIVSLSLGSMVSMEFTHPDGTQHSKVLLPRSLLVMTGESRYLWNHGITPRKHDVVAEAGGEDGMTLATRGIRTSFTFRAVRGRPCQCAFPSKCDSQIDMPAQPKAEPLKPEVQKPNSEAEAMELEERQVHRVYNEIAPHFSYTRYKPWPHVSTFLNGLEDGSLVLDVGCGNGKYIGVNPRVFMIGCDRSEELISICGQRGHEVLVCDGLTVNMKSDLFDACISIAVIHHFSTEHRRLDAVKELVRLLRPGGEALIYVWAMEQTKQDKKSIYLMKKKSQAAENSSGDIIPSLESTNLDETSSNTKLGSDTNLGTGSEDKGETENLEEKMQRMKVTFSDQEESIGEESLGHEEHEYSSEIKANCIGNSQSETQSRQTTDNSSEDVKTTLTVHVNKTEFKDQDLLVPWHLRGENKTSSSVGAEKSIFYRFYHVFQEGELEDLIDQVDGVSVKKSYYDQGNWCVIIKKQDR